MSGDGRVELAIQPAPAEKFQKKCSSPYLALPVPQSVRVPLNYSSIIQSLGYEFIIVLSLHWYNSCPISLVVRVVQKS